MSNASLSKTKTFRFLYEKVSERGKIAWTVITGCSDQEDAIDFFRQSFPFSEYEMLQITEVLD